MWYVRTKSETIHTYSGGSPLMKTKLLTLALLAALLTLLICTASAAQPTSGSCGPNLNWNLDKATGVLTISGTGPMED